MKIGRKLIKTVYGKISKKPFIYDKDSGTFIIKFDNLVGFLYPKTTEYLKKVKRMHIPIHLLIYVDENCSNVIITDGIDYKIVINPMGIEKPSSEKWLTDILKFINENYEKF